MSENIVVYKSLNSQTAASIVFGVLSFLTGYLLGPTVVTHYSDNLPILLIAFLGIPLCFTFLGIIIGSSAKSRVEYTLPEWEYSVEQLAIEEAKKIPGSYLRKYIRLAPNGHFWLFYTPLLVLLGILGFPFYALLLEPQYIPYIEWILSLGLPLVFILSLLLGFFASSNDASKDFTLPLIREALWMARRMSKTPSYTNIKIVLDKAELDGFITYANPRVLGRISGIENKAYVEVWTNELGAVTNLLCRIHQTESMPKIVWWWLANDRLFRKYVDEDQEGYYVKYPVSSRVQDIGVKDVTLLLRNAASLLILEWTKHHETTQDLEQFLESLGVKRLK